MRPWYSASRLSRLESASGEKYIEVHKGILEVMEAKMGRASEGTCHGDVVLSQTDFSMSCCILDRGIEVVSTMTQEASHQEQQKVLNSSLFR